MEAAFDRSFADVKVYGGQEARGASEALDAEAYTVGNRIAFRDESPARETVAHELAHVVQHAEGRAAPAAHAKSMISSAGDPLEDEADAVAASVVAGRGAGLPSGGHSPIGTPGGANPPVQRRAAKSVGAAPASVGPPAAKDAAAVAAKLQQMRAALPLITTRWKLIGGDIFDEKVKTPTIQARFFGHAAYALIVRDQTDLPPVLAVLAGPGREEHLEELQAAGNAFLADKPHFELLQRSADDLRAGGQIQYNATRVMAQHAMLSPHGKRALVATSMAGVAELGDYIMGSCREHGELEAPGGGGDLRVKGCQAILATLRTGAPPDLPAQRGADATKADSPELEKKIKDLKKAIAQALIRRKSLAAGGTLTLTLPEQAMLGAALEAAGPEARARVWEDKAVVAQLVRVLDPKQAKEIFARLDPIEELARACASALAQDEGFVVDIHVASMPPEAIEEVRERKKLKVKSSVFQELRSWLLAHAGAKALRMRVLQHTKLKDDYVDRLPNDEKRLIYRLIIRGTETATAEDQVHEAADKKDALGVIQGMRALAGSDPAKLAALEKDPSFRATLDGMTEPVELPDGQKISAYQLCMMMWGRRPEERTDPNAIQQTEINPDSSDDAPLTIPERIRLDRELFDPALTELNDEIIGKNLDDYQRRLAKQYGQRLGHPQKVMDTLVKYDRMAAQDPLRALLRREKLVFGPELEKRYFTRFGQALRTWIYENSGPNNRSGSDRVLGLEQGAGVGMFNGKVVMAGEAAVNGKMSLQQALRETVYEGKPIYEHSSVQSRELSRALDDANLGGVNGAWCYFEAAVEACQAELDSLTGIKVRAIDLMRNAYMEHGGHLETRLALKFKGDDLAFVRKSMGLKPGLDDDPSAGGPTIAEQAKVRFEGIAKLVWDGLNGLQANSPAYAYTAVCMLMQIGRTLPPVNDHPDGQPPKPPTTAVGHDQEERPPRSFAGFYRSQYGAHPDRHAAAVLRAMGNKRAVPAETAAEMLKIDVALVTGPIVAEHDEDSSIGPHNRHLIRADFTTEKAASNAKEIWTLLHVNDGKLATITAELYGPYNDEEQRLIRVEFRKLSGGFDLTFYIQQAIASRERTLRNYDGPEVLKGEVAKHSQFAIGAAGTAEGKILLGGDSVLIHGSATELEAALAVASHGEMNAVDRVRNAVGRRSETEVLRVIDDLTVDERRQVLKNGKLIDDMERFLGQRDYERAFKVLTGQADLADRLMNNSIGRSWWKRHVSHAADVSGMKEDVREYIRRLRLQMDKQVREELVTKLQPKEEPPPPQVIEQEIDRRTREACMDLAADKDIKQIIDDVLGRADREEIKSTLRNAGEAKDWALVGGGSRDQVLGEIKAMSADERKAKLEDPNYLQQLGDRLTNEKDFRDAVNALSAHEDGVGKDGLTGAGGIAKLDEKSRSSAEIHGASTDGRATLRALAALSPEELTRLANDPQMQLQVMSALGEDQRTLARELLFPSKSALPASATSLDPALAARLEHQVRQAIFRIRIACKTSNKWSTVLEESVEVYKAPLDPAPAAVNAHPGALEEKDAASKRIPPGLRAEVWKQVSEDVTAFANDHDAHRGAVTSDAITGAKIIEVVRGAVLRQRADGGEGPGGDPSDYLISAKIWTAQERLGDMSSEEAALVKPFVDDKYNESDVVAALSSASDEHVAREWSSVSATPSGGGETMTDRYRLFRASFLKAKQAILRQEAAEDAAAPPPASSTPDTTIDASTMDPAVAQTGAPVPVKPKAPRWSSDVHTLGGDDPDIAKAEEDKQRFLLYVIQVSRKLEQMLRPYMGDNREITADRDPNAAKTRGTGNKRYDNLVEVILGRIPRLDPKVLAEVIGVEEEDRWILSTAARTEIGMFNLRHEKNLRSRGQQTSERSVASEEKEGLDVSRVAYGRALAVSLTDGKMDKDEQALVSHLGERNDDARDAYKTALETAAMWASLIVGTLVTVVVTILTGGLALGPVAAMAIGAATAALSATAKSYVNKQILDNEWDSQDTNELIAHEVLTSLVTIGTTYYASKFMSTLGGLGKAAKQASAMRGLSNAQPPMWRVFLNQVGEQVASEGMSTVVDAGLEATDPMHWIDGYREGAAEAKAAGWAKIKAAPEAMARGVVTSLLTAGISKMMPSRGGHVDFSDAAKQTRSINIARNIKKVFGDPEQKLTGALVEWAMNQSDPIDWSSAPAELFQGTLRQYGQVATEMHSHTASVGSRGRHAQAQLAMHGNDMTAAERTSYFSMNEHAGSSDPLVSARDYTNLRRQVAEMGLGQWESAHPERALTHAQREAFITWVREASTPDDLSSRAKVDPTTVREVQDAGKPAPRGDHHEHDVAAPGAGNRAVMMPAYVDPQAGHAEQLAAQRPTQTMQVPDAGEAAHQRKTQGMDAPDAEQAAHQRKTQVIEVPAHGGVDPRAHVQVPQRSVHEDFPDLKHLGHLSEDVIGFHQRGVVEGKLQALSPDGKQAFQSLLGMMSTPVGRGFLYKALAAGNPISDIHWLAMQSMGRNDMWLLDNLTLSDPRGVGAGLMQQWSMGCNSAMTLTMRGNYDPVFALGLRLSNPNISTADFHNPLRFNEHLARMEGDMLQSAYQGDATPEARGHGGIAVPHSHGESKGRWADDLLNAEAQRTGLEFTTNKNVTPSEALHALDSTLQYGVQVPIVVGSDKSKYAHYMLVTMSRPGQDGTPWYRISDSATGRSTWVSREQILTGRMPFGSGQTITAVEQPRPAGQPAQLTPAEAPALASPAVLAVTQQMPAAYATQTIALQAGGETARTTTASNEQAPTSNAAAKTLIIPVPVQEAVADVVRPTAQAAAKSVAAPKPGATHDTAHDPAREAFTAKWKNKPVDIETFKQQYSFEYQDAKARIERVKEASPEVAAVLGRVPEHELVAILLYTSTHFVEWNRTLREQDAGAEGLHEHGAGIALAEQGLAKLPTYQGTVHRGTTLSAEKIAKYVPGEVVTEDGFTSTSSQQSGTDNYKGNVQFVIESKTGRSVDALSRYDNEKEILFKPGTKFIVTDKERNGDQIIIRMKEVDAEGAPGGPGGPGMRHEPDENATRPRLRLDAAPGVDPASLPHLGEHQRVILAKANERYAKVASDSRQKDNAIQAWETYLRHHGIDVGSTAGALPNRESAVEIVEQAAPRFAASGGTAASGVFDFRPDARSSMLADLTRGDVLPHATVGLPPRAVLTGDGEMMLVRTSDGRRVKVRIVEPRHSRGESGMDLPSGHNFEQMPRTEDAIVEVWVAPRLQDHQIGRALAGALADIQHRIDHPIDGQAQAAQFGIMRHMLAELADPANEPLVRARLDAEVDQMMVELGLSRRAGTEQDDLLAHVPPDLRRQVRVHLSRATAVGFDPSRAATDRVIDAPEIRAIPTMVGPSSVLASSLPDGSVLRPYNADDRTRIVEMRLHLATIAEIDSQLARRDMAGTEGGMDAKARGNIAQGESLRREQHVAEVQRLLGELQLYGNDRGYYVRRLAELEAMFPGANISNAVLERVDRRARREQAHTKAQFAANAYKQRSDELTQDINSGARPPAAERIIIGDSMAGITDYNTLGAAQAGTLVIGGDTPIANRDGSERWGQRPAVFDREGYVHPMFEGAPDADRPAGLAEDPGDFLRIGELSDTMELARESYRMSAYRGSVVGKIQDRPASPPADWAHPEYSLRVLVMHDGTARWFYANHIDVASGPGGTRMPNEGILSGDDRNALRSSQTLVSGADFLNQSRGFDAENPPRVFVYAFGPTGAWAASKAAKLGASGVDWGGSVADRGQNRSTMEFWRRGLDRAQDAFANEAIHRTEDPVIQMQPAGDHGAIVTFLGSDGAAYQVKYDKIVVAMGHDNSAPSSSSGLGQQDSVAKLIGNFEMRAHRSGAAAVESIDGRIRIFGAAATSGPGLQNAPEEIRRFQQSQKDQNAQLAADSPPPGDTMEFMGQVLKILNVGVR